MEPSSVGSSAIPEYKRMGVSVVENIDTKFGKLELVSLMETNRMDLNPTVYRMMYTPECDIKEFNLDKE